jgi:DNA-binding MarR family transcriptional regulator
MKSAPIPTYRAAVIQSRAHRTLKTKVSQFLRGHGITMMQWSIIGLIYDAGDYGMRISDIARELDTSMAFITTTVNILEAKGIVTKSSHDRDNRAKIVRLEATFLPKVSLIEDDLRIKMNEWLYRFITPEEMDAYMKVLNLIAHANG